MKKFQFALICAAALALVACEKKCEVCGEPLADCTCDEVCDVCGENPCVCPGEYVNPIDVTDGSAADWDALPAEYVASAVHAEGCSMDGLKSVKVYCDEMYLNVLVEVNLDVVTDHEWTSFHIYLNADGCLLEKN